MLVNIYNQNDLDYLLQVLEEKGYRWMSGTLPTRLRPGLRSNFYLHIFAVHKRIAYGFDEEGDTGFNEVFDRI